MVMMLKINLRTLGLLATETIKLLEELSTKQFHAVKTLKIQLPPSELLARSKVTYTYQDKMKSILVVGRIYYKNQPHQDTGQVIKATVTHRNMDRELQLFVTAFQRAGSHIREFNTKLKSAQETFRVFTGSTSTSLNHHVQPDLSTPPDIALIHVGITDLLSNQHISTDLTIAENIMAIGKKC